VATWLAEPIARVRAIIEGSYPVSPVAGRSVTAGRIQRATYRDDPASLEWVGVGFHRHYLLQTDETGDRDGDPVNRRAGAAREDWLFTVRIGYVVQPDARVVRDDSCVDEDAATQLGHEDFHAIREALRWPEFWGDTSPAISQIVPAGKVRTSIVIPRRRVFVSAQFAATLSYAPGSTWT
jgi:hypothetical protein